MPAEPKDKDWEWQAGEGNTFIPERQVDGSCIIDPLALPPEEADMILGKQLMDALRASSEKLKDLPTQYVQLVRVDEVKQPEMVESRAKGLQGYYERLSDEAKLKFFNAISHAIKWHGWDQSGIAIGGGKGHYGLEAIAQIMHIFWTELGVDLEVYT